MERAPVSVVIAARDAAAHITECVSSVRDWASEVLVVENDSRDDTVERARAAGATVFTNPFRTIGAQRNAAIARATQPWIFVLDADERCTPELAAEIARTVKEPTRDAYRVLRRNFFLRREIRHGGWERDRPVRLFRAAMRYDERPVHEHVVTKGAVGTLESPMLHYTYDSLAQYFEKFDRYSRWWAEQQHARGRHTTPLAILVKPPARFVSMYLLRGGFRDGPHGLVLAVLAAMSVAAKYARLWALDERR
ncbi:MAG TPA: glycosyltransferase family 2 protein [Gemmatimonadaceae bacterium]|nr:glycosyltransferase family 2 protein [Gemmatimonadaceae bacterium]